MPTKKSIRSSQNYALAMLTSVYMLSLVDRGLVMLLLEPIKNDLHLSDTQLGLVTGIAFALFYAVLGVPIARLSDRKDRVAITSLALGLWGLTVMACMLVTNYWQLLVARVLAAIGESGCKPPTYALIGDIFPESAQRTRAMSIYLSGNYIQIIFSFIAGGFLNQLFGWRVTFFIMGVVGIALAIVVRATLKDPRTLSAPSARSTPPALSAVLNLLWARRSCRHLCAALIILYLIGAGLGPWYAAFLIRTHGASTGELGIWLGFIFGGGGIAGVLAGGYISSRFFENDEQKQIGLSAAVVSTFAIWLVMFLFSANFYVALFALLPLVVVYSFILGPTYVLLQRLVPDDMRATMMAIIMLFANLIGMGLGPLIVGSLSDALRGTFGNDGLRYAMMSMSFTGFWAAWHFWKAAGALGADLRTVEDWNANQYSTDRPVQADLSTI